MFLSHGVPAEEDVLCPVCYSKAPHRLAYLFIQNHFRSLMPEGSTCLHIAPEPKLGRQLATLCKRNGVVYEWGGITASGSNNLDIRKMRFADSSIDFIYCCHVLNMVREDRQAMEEVYRVLKPTGVAILQVPAYFPGPLSKEVLDGSEEDRKQAFCDPRMYRIYSDEDYASRLIQAGFHVRKFSTEDVAPEVREKSSLNREAFHIVFKGKSHPLAAILGRSESA